LHTQAQRVDVPPGFRYRPEEVIGHYLRFVHGHLKQDLVHRFGRAASTCATKYCLTVPAGWSEKAKHSMRE
jgi:hypothetical protein